MRVYDCMGNILNFVLFFTIVTWGFVVLLLAVLFFLKLFPEKRNWLGVWTEKGNRTFKIGRAIIIGWLLLTLFFMTIEVCILLVASYKTLSPDHQKMAEHVLIGAFASFSVLLPAYIYMQLIPKIFRRSMINRK